MRIDADAHDPSARFAGTSPSREPAMGRHDHVNFDGLCSRLSETPEGIDGCNASSNRWPRVTA